MEERSIAVSVSLDAPNVKVSEQEKRAILDGLKGTRITDILSQPRPQAVGQAQQVVEWRWV